MNLSVPVGGKLWEGPFGPGGFGRMVSWNKISAAQGLDDFMEQN